MTRQQDRATLSDPADAERAAARALPAPPDRYLAHLAADRPGQPDRHPIDQHRQASVTEQLRERLWRLPPGHPSSPYDGEGRLRPPVPDYRQLERPFPEREGYDGREPKPQDAPHEPATGEQPLANGQAGRDAMPDRGPGADQRQVQAWHEALPRLQELWHKHEEKWPESERPPVDRSSDEPGSWRGDSDCALSPQENHTAEEIYAGIAVYERNITRQMEDVELTSLGKLAGKEFALKGKERFKDKVATALDSAPEAGLDRAVANIRDVVRYTLQYDEAHYADGVRADVGALQNRGFQLEKLKNLWSADEYKGINSQWTDKASGQSFEVQFHTQISFEAKQLTHGAYERIRTMRSADHPSDQAELNDLHAYQRAVCTEIPVPDGALEITN